ncbi:MAG: restriction endonuclease [Bryobacteraceae bacterium]|jgi:restriction system protein
MYEKAGATIAHYESQLARRWVQLVRQDAYGQLQLGGWVKEVDYFISSCVSPSLTGDEQAALEGEREEVARMITERAKEITRDKPVFKAFSENMTPTEFEVFCAEELRQSGWDARVTLQSHDQGVDVVAEKAGVRVVLQCKLYSKPVGNKAVQEVAAAKAHERAHYGAVVSNSRYTPAAEQLAATNAILLLHYSDLANLEAFLR